MLCERHAGQPVLRRWSPLRHGPKPELSWPRRICMSLLGPSAAAPAAATTAAAP